MTTDKREEVSMEQDEGALSGSREPSPDDLGPSGFDPARWHPEQHSFAKEIADEVLRDSGGLGIGGAAVHAGAMVGAARAWLREHPAIAMEARQDGDGETRLHPKDGRPVLVFGTPRYGPACRRHAIAHFETGRGWREIGDRPFDVEAWQPLPDPPGHNER